MLKSVEEALNLIAAATQPLHAVRVPLTEAVHCVLAEPARAHFDLPRFTQSAVDGYALRHQDLTALPQTLPLSGHVAAAAQSQAPDLKPGTAMRILTGGMLPTGADTVVRQEKTRKQDAAIDIVEAVGPGTDIRPQGEECREGSVIAKVGTLVTPALIAPLATAGVENVSVRQPPRIVVLTTGDEIVSDGSKLRLGQIPDSNGPQLAAWSTSWGIPPLRVEHVPDHEEDTRNALERAFADADMVLSCGGVSVGDHDYIPAAARAIGAREVLWKVAQKPGMPLFVAERAGRLLFGLPGNPGSVLVNLLIYVRTAILRMQGMEPPREWSRFATVKGATIQPEPTRVRWVRGIIDYTDDGRCNFEALGGQASHMLGNLAQANALARIPRGSTAPTWVRWMPI